jgi:hypothetical protein
MPRLIRWLLLSLGALSFVALAGVVTVSWWSHLNEGTYNGPHTNILSAGTRVVIMQDYVLAGGETIAKSSSGMVQTDPAWDEDSCDPNRPITLALPSGQSVSLPRRILHRLEDI